MQIKILLTIAVILGASTSLAQDEYKRGVQPNPCAQAIPKGHQLNLDFGQLCRYEDANAKLPAPSANRVIYFGDSLTQGWGNLIPGLDPRDTINRGISGQTTAQMLVRYRADVINLKPRVVHLLMGTNDIAGNTGATSIARIKDSISSMAEQSRAKGIKVVLASILPAKEFSWRPGIDPRNTIRELNQWLRLYAAKEGFVYVDYFSALSDTQGGFDPSLCTDGVHPNQAGYNKMTALAIQAIRRATQQ
jgi:acyl-CoA thioesterase I